MKKGKIKKGDIFQYVNRKKASEILATFKKNNTQ
jgi:hypothetical protein